MARFSSGWVKIHRKAILGDIYSNYTRGGLFTVLVGIANLQGSSVSWRGKPRSLERGELVTSMTELSNLGEVDRKTVEKHLLYLHRRGTITLEKSQQGILIKILNFDFYQGLDAEGGKWGPDAMDNAMVNGVPHIEERKNKRKKDSDHKLWPLYEQLVSDYPIKVSKSSAGFKRFCEHVKDEGDFSVVMLHLARYKKHLTKNPWKAPKQSIETFFGTKQSGYFWLQWDSDDAGDPKLKAVGTLDIVER